jgi:hypothetical protein
VCLGRMWTRPELSSGTLLGEIVLKPTPEGLKAQLQGNIRGLLTFDEQAPVLLGMVAGGPLLSIPVRRVLVA